MPTPDLRPQPPGDSNVHEDVTRPGPPSLEVSDSFSGSTGPEVQPGRPREITALPYTFGRYRLEQRLGRGGMGTVYLAFDTQLCRQVALKMPFWTGPDAEVARARFLREARAAAALSHPNICSIHDIGEVDGAPYLTMAFIRGEPLSRKLRPGQPLEPRAAAELVLKVALALEVAHGQGIIHRDLKPGNLMIDERGEPIVMDFGLARRQDASQLTQQGEVMGTPVYMSPEQVTGNNEAVGSAADIWSLGIVLYQLLTGRLPFEGDLLALVGQIPLDEPPPLSRWRPGLDPRLEPICLKALAKSPSDRWPSMRHFADALREFLAPPLPAMARPPERIQTFLEADKESPQMTLRIEGTPYAYRALHGQEIITLGRQRRKPGQPNDQGNDVVLRVPGNDELSGRISRCHLEIRRRGADYSVTDLSKAGTMKNGQPLIRGEPASLAAGDRLIVAGVLTVQRYGIITNGL